jgi:hypothetical protein
MSESEKTKYWDLLSPRFQRFYNFAVEASAGKKEIVLDLFEYRVATKGLLLSSTRKISQAILASGNTELINDYAEWIDAKEEMTKLYVFSKEDMQEQGINLDSLDQVVNAMEKKLSENSKEFSQFYFTSKIKYAEVQDKLKADEALVEMIRLRILTRPSPTIAVISHWLLQKTIRSQRSLCCKTDPIWRKNFSRLTGNPCRTRSMMSNRIIISGRHWKQK